MKAVTLHSSQISVVFEDTGAGHVLVLLHAFPFDSEMWAEQRQGLADRYRVITPDLPGFGGSANSAGLTIDSAADNVAELLDHLGINERVSVGGLSMGGYVALAFSRLYPQRLRTLILADTKADPDDEAGRQARNAMIEAATTHGPREIVDRLIPKLLASTTISDRPEIVRRVRAIAERQTTEGIVAGLKALRDRPDASAGLGHISVPTLVIVGEQDAVTPLDKARAMASAIPDARLVVLPACGHMSNLEDGDGFTKSIRQFLDGLPGEIRAPRNA